MRTICVAALYALALLSAGCLVSGHSNVERKGTYVAESTIDRITPGKTDKAWVRAVIGEATERVPVDLEREIWKYAYSETKSSGGYVFLIFGGSDRKVTQGSVFIEFEKDLVARTWRG
jgi:outer membrane protein assembly factor BamE (lipoprotein component of BamABCDE complex)